jgi:uncharacterized protein
MTDAPLLTRRLERLRALVQDRASGVDLAHDHHHLLRVYRWAVRLAPEAGADPELAGAAALVHDLSAIPKDSPDRNQGGERSADQAREPLAEAGFGADEVDTILGAVRTSSWSAELAPDGPVGVVLQDADRLDAIGALGIARTFTTAQSIHSRTGALGLAAPEDPLARCGRSPDERRWAVDHFATKLLGLAAGMRLPSARTEAARRQSVMDQFLTALEREIEEQYRPEPSRHSVI